MSKPTQKTHPEPHPGESEAAAKHAHDDDVIVVPKGSSKTRFLMTALLAGLVLTTFTVSGEVVDVLTGRSKSGGHYMSWKRPDGTTHKLNGGDFLVVKQNLSKAQALMSGGRTSKDDDAEVARHILADDLAQYAGIHVTDGEVGKMILSVFGSNDVYKQALARYRTSAKEFEHTLRSMLRVRRYQTLLSAGYAVPDPQKIEDKWKESHRERTVEVVELPLERFETEAAAAAPAGDELKAWYEALSEPEKSTYRKQLEAKTSAEFAWFHFEPQGTSTEKLLAAYPRPAGEDADQVARTWYEANKLELYKKPDAAPGTPAADAVRPFEEVQDRARTEGIAYQSILDWVNDMKTRQQNGDTIVLVEDATRVGFGYRQEPSTHTRAEWSAIGMSWGGQGAIDAMFNPANQVGQFLSDVVVDPKGIYVGRLLAREDSRMQEFDEIQDAVRAGWVKKKKSDLGIAKLEELRAKFSTVPDPADETKTIPVEPDAEKFAAAAKELGLEVQKHEGFDAGAQVKPGVTPVELFMRRFVNRRKDTAGAIAEPEVSSDKTVAWTARLGESRDPDVSRMTPLEYENEASMASYESRSDFLQANFFSDEALKQRYALDLEFWRKQAESSAPGGAK